MAAMFNLSNLETFPLHGSFGIFCFLPAYKIKTLFIVTMMISRNNYVMIMIIIIINQYYTNQAHS